MRMICTTQALQTNFVAGTVPDSLQVRAFDGVLWSAPDNGAWAPFTVMPYQPGPVIQVGNKVAMHVNAVHERPCGVGDSVD